MFKLISLSTLCLVIALTFTCCKKKGSTSSSTDFVDIDRSDTTSLPYPIPAVPTAIDFSAPPLGPVQLDTFATKVDQYISPYGFTKNDIVKVNLTKLQMVIENAPGQTFDFVKDTLISIRIFVDSFGGTAPKMVAHKDHITPGINTLVLDVETNDIKDYFRADYMKISAGFWSQENQALDGASKFRVNYTFRVTFNKP